MGLGAAGGLQGVGLGDSTALKPALVASSISNYSGEMLLYFDTAIPPSP